MRSRRREDYGRLSPASRVRSRNLLEEWDRSPRRRRSSSSSRLDESQYPVGVDRRGDSNGRRDYAWHAEAAGNSRVHLRPSPPPRGQGQRGPLFDEGFVHSDYVKLSEVQRSHDTYEPSDYIIDDARSRRRYLYSYGQNDPRVAEGNEIMESRLVAGDVCGTVGQKAITVDNATSNRSYHFPLDLDRTSSYHETVVRVSPVFRSTEMHHFENDRGIYKDTDYTSNYPDPHGRLSPVSHTMYMQQLDHEKYQHRDAISSDKIQVMEDPIDRERAMSRSRDALYPVESESCYREFSTSYELKGFATLSEMKRLKSSSEMKEFASSSSGMLRSKVLDSCPDDLQSGPSDELPRSHRSFNASEQRLLLDSMIHHEGDQRIKHGDYSYPKQQGMGNDRRKYPSAHLSQEMLASTESEYDFACIRHDRKDPMGPRVSGVALDNLEYANDSHPALVKVPERGHPTLCKEIFVGGRVTNAWKEEDGVMRARYDVERRFPLDHRRSNGGASHDFESSPGRIDYEFGRDAYLQFQRGKHPDSYMSNCELEILANAERMKKMEGHLPSEMAERMVKGKYRNDEEITAVRNRNKMPSQRNAPGLGEIRDFCDSDEEWVYEDMRDPHPFAEFVQVKKSKRLDTPHEGYAFDDFHLSNGHLVESEDQDHGTRYLRGHPSHGSFSWHDTYHMNRRDFVHKKHKIRKRNESDNLLDVRMGPPDSEQFKDSEKFGKLVHQAFLNYSKKLNMKSDVRKRYTEQGKAGSLYCIVCGMSVSKEFTDTKSLATHAFMSPKVGLRAKHLGLHKAVCVLLGWNSATPGDSKMWIPQLLPKEEALTQKEDLLLWPPVIVIRNISLSEKNPDKWKVIPIGDIEAFLKGKGFIKGGMKLCLGRPADQSVILVKFMGTFSGLEDAERLHEYFGQDKRGRMDFERERSKSSKSSSSSKCGVGEGIEEQILYGYLGIAEDLRHLDLNTKSRCLIRSKKDIQELANAPVKPGGG